jgi:hypothetical protein
VDSDLHLVVEGDAIVFRLQENDGHRGVRVVWPECSMTVDRGKAKRHYTRNHINVLQDGASLENGRNAELNDETGGTVEERRDILLHNETTSSL